MWKKIATAAVIGCVVIALVAQLTRSATESRADTAITALAKRESFDVTITESGVLEALRSETFSCQIPSNSAKIVYLVPEGTQVETDDVLIRFDPTPFEQDKNTYRYQMQEAEAAATEAAQEVELERVRSEREAQAAVHAVRLAELQLQNVMAGEGPIALKEAENAMVQSKMKLEQARSHLRDLEELRKEDFVSAEEVDKARQAADEAAAANELAKLRFDTRRDYIYPAEQEKAKKDLAMAKTDASQLEQSLWLRMEKAQAVQKRAEATRDLARENLQNAANLLDKTVVKASIPGFVVYREFYIDGVRRKPRIGDSVWMNQGIITLPDITTMIVESQVREIDIHKIKLGQEVRVTVQAYPQPVHTGRVDLIGTLASTDPRTGSASKYFSLRVVLDGSDNRLRPGMSARIGIVVDTVRDKLTVPVSAVFWENGTSCCYVSSGGGIERREVATGPADDVRVVIESGLEEGERVCLRKPDSGSGSF